MPSRSDRRRGLLRFAAWALVIAGTALVAVVAYQHLTAPAPPPAERTVPRERRPLVLVTLDTTRPDRLEPYGAESVETPNLARLARQGVVFEDAYAVAPITLVAHTSIHTGLEPPRHGVRNNGLHSVPEDLDTLAERLRDAGYATGAFVSAAVLERRYRLDQGFDVYDDDLSTGRQRHPRMVADRPAEAAVASAVEWLDSVPAERPFFLWLHLYDPHAAYSPPPPWRDRYRDRLYDGEVAYMDHHLGRLLRHPRVDGEAVVSVLGDHGESLGEHGEQTHALLAYDSTLHVPWIVSVPGGPRGLRLRHAVGQVDALPTLLDLLDLPVPPPGEVTGVSLVPMMEGRGRPDRTLYAETFLPFYTYGWSKLRVLRDGRYKWIDAPTPELYDTVRDPRELSDRSEREPDLAHDLARALEERLAGYGDADREASLSLDSEARERLRSLGYLSVGSGATAGDRERPDPKEMVDLHVGLERARQLQRDRLFAAAEDQLRQVLRRDPTNLAALIDLASVLEEQRRLDEAARTVERALALDPEYVRLHVQLAGIEVRRGDVERALELLDLALARDPGYLEARLRKAVWLHRGGRRAEADALLAELLEDEPETPQVLVLHARLVDLPGDPAAAEERVRSALERDPFLVSGWQLLGEILEGTGRTAEAVDTWRRGLERRPDDAEIHARLGLALARAGGDEAEVHLREALRLSPDFRPELHVALGGWLGEHGRFQEAQVEYERVLEVEPDHPGARNNRAIALYQSGRLEEAEAELLELVERHPRHADAHSNLAAIALGLERHAEAEERARRALALTPRSPESWNNLGLALAGQGEPQEAERCYRRALDLEPGYWQASLNLGTLLRRQGRGGDAEETLRALVEERPGLADAHLQLGLLYADEPADAERARAHLNAFLRRAPAHPDAGEARERLATLPPAP